MKFERNNKGKIALATANQSRRALEEINDVTIEDLMGAILGNETNIALVNDQLNTLSLSLNQSILRIDNSILNMENRITQVETSILNMENRITEVETSILNMENRITQLEQTSI